MARILSASQLATFELCPRKWAFSRRAGGEPDTPATIIGNKVHDVLERYCRDGAAPDLATEEGMIASRGLGMLPPPGTGIAEGDISFEVDGIAFRGRVDLQWYDAESQCAHVIDHKTFGSTRPKNDFANDLQRALYARWAIQQYPDATAVECEWIYYPKRAKDKGFSRRLVRTRDGAISDFDRLIRDQAVAMLAASSDPFENPRRTTGCTAYGGCAWMSECFESSDRSIVPVSSLQDRLRRARGEQPVESEPAAEPAPAPEQRVIRQAYKPAETPEPAPEPAPEPVPAPVPVPAPEPAPAPAPAPVPEPAPAPARRAAKPRSQPTTVEPTLAIFLAGIDAGLSTVEIIDRVEAYRRCH